MYYDTLFGVLEGLEKDNNKIIETINVMEKNVEATNEKCDNKNVYLGHNGNTLYYKLWLDRKEIEGKISFGTIYHRKRARIQDEYEKIIAELIEEDAILKQFPL